MIRDILKIDEDKCNGCGLCVPNCHEGALQVIDGKVRLVSELMCDGLGACIGHCPEDAITIEKREAAPYDETMVIKEMIGKGKNTIIAHLKHLKDHGEHGYLKEGVAFLMSYDGNPGFSIEEVISTVHNYKPGQQTAQQPSAVHADHHVHVQPSHIHGGGGCPGSRERVIEKPAASAAAVLGADMVPSELRQWPVQMHLVNPNASYFRNSDMLLAADCVAFSMGNFHGKFLKGRSLGIACPKLDSNTETYIEKLRLLIDEAHINTLTVMIMEVPCCSGLLQMAKNAVSKATRKVPLKMMMVGINGEVLKEEWV